MELLKHCACSDIIHFVSSTFEAEFRSHLVTWFNYNLFPVCKINSNMTDSQKKTLFW